MTPFKISLHYTANSLHIEAEGRIIRIPGVLIKFLKRLIGMFVNRQEGQPVLCFIKDGTRLQLQRYGTLEEKPTEREIEVGQLLALGHSAKAAGLKLFISTDTVEWHRKNLYRKLGIKKKHELLAAMVRHNLM